jgi:hypothetical protein
MRACASFLCEQIKGVCAFLNECRVYYYSYALATHTRLSFQFLRARAFYNDDDAISPNNNDDDCSA